MTKRRIFITLFIIFSVLACAIFAIPRTEWGTKISLGIIESSVEGLALNYHQGNFANQLEFDRITFQQNERLYTLENINLDLALDCLWRKTLCINNLSVENFEYLDSSPQSTSGNESSIASILSDLPAISLPFSLELNEIALLQASFTLPESSYTLNELALDAHWQNSTLEIHGLSLNYNEQASLMLTGDVELDHSYPMDFQLDLDIQQFSPWPSLNQSQIQGHFEGDLQKLFFTLNSQGEMELQATGEFQPAIEDLPFAISLDATHLPLPESYTELVQASIINIEVEGNIQNQEINIESNVSGYTYDNAILNASLIHQNQVLEIESFIFNDPLTLSEASAAGTINFQNGIAWQGSINLTDFVLPSLLPARGQFTGQLNSQGSFNDGAWNLELSDTELEGQLNGLPAKLQGNFSLNHFWQMPDSNFHLELNDLILEIQGFTDEQWHINGSLSANSLQQWDLGLEGQGEILFEISGDSENPIISANGTLNSLSWSDFYAPALALNGSYQPMNQHQLSLKIDVENLRRSSYSISDTQLSINGDIDQHMINFHSTGDINSNVELSGTWLEDEDRWQGQIFENSDIGLSDFEWLLQDTINLDFNVPDSQLSVSAHCWQGQQNNFCLRQDAELGSVGHLDIGLNADLAFVAKFLLPPQLQLETRLEGSIALDWSDNSPTFVDAKFTLEPGQLLYGEPDNPLEVLHWQNGVVNINADNDTANLLFVLQEQDFSLVNIDLTLTDKLQTITGKAQLADITLQPIGVLVDEIKELNGSLNGDIIISGQTDSPQLSGNFSIDQASLNLTNIPTPIEPIALELDFKGQQAELMGEFYIGEDQGNISGEILWNDQLTMDIDLNAQQLNIIYPPQLMATISPELSMSLQPEKLILNGQIDVLAGTLTLEQLTEGGVSPSRDQIFINDESLPINQEGRFDIESDIFVSIDPSFELEAAGFTGHLTGQMQLVHRQDLLQLFGSLEIPDGRYTAYGQRLEVERGSLSFNGPATNPNIDLRAFREIPRENVIAGVQVQGQSSSPDISLYSEPPMEQSETMSYLLRGRGLDSAVGTSTILNLAMGATKFGTSSIFQEIEESSSISNIEINTEGAGDDTQATISGYIGNRLYLKYGVGVYEPINELTVRLYFLNRLWLETISGLQQSSADLYYSFEVD